MEAIVLHSEERSATAQSILYYWRLTTQSILRPLLVVLSGSTSGLSKRISFCGSRSSSTHPFQPFFTATFFRGPRILFGGDACGVGCFCCIGYLVTGSENRIVNNSHLTSPCDDPGSAPQGEACLAPSWNKDCIESRNGLLRNGMQLLCLIF